MEKAHLISETVFSTANYLIRTLFGSLAHGLNAVSKDIEIHMRSITILPATVPAGGSKACAVTDLQVCGVARGPHVLGR